MSSRVESHDVLVQHPLEETDPRVPVLEDDPILFELAGDLREVELFVEGLGGLDVLDGEADRKIPQLHGFLLLGLRGSSRDCSCAGDYAQDTGERECFHVNSAPGETSAGC